MLIFWERRTDACRSVIYRAGRKVAQGVNGGGGVGHGRFPCWVARDTKKDKVLPRAKPGRFPGSTLDL
jgi:hypothetical protein